MAEQPVAIITGAGRGIGRATAIELSSRGFRVVLVSRTRSQLDETSRLLSTEWHILEGDVTDPVFCEHVSRETINRFGQIDALVNNAGLAPALSIEATDDATWRAVLDTNVSSAFYLSRSCWAALKATRGAIVNLSSEAARDPFPGFVAYAPAKAAVNLLTVVLHREGKEHGIRAYAVAPSATETAMLRQLVTADQLPSEQTLAPGDVARTIAGCILGDLRHASGEVIYVHR
jgi:NAD(P)-dependent dehydrogenase (short-subunit alcohol dehydrogenase family)